MVPFGAGRATKLELRTQVADHGDRVIAIEDQFNEVNSSVAGPSATTEQLVEAKESHTLRFDVAMAQFVLDIAEHHLVRAYR